MKTCPPPATRGNYSKLQYNIYMLNMVHMIYTYMYSTILYEYMIDAYTRYAIYDISKNVH